MNKIMIKVICNCKECCYLIKFPTNNLSNYNSAYCQLADKIIGNVSDLSKDNFKFAQFCPLKTTKEKVTFSCLGCSNCNQKEIIKKEENNRIDIYCKKLNKIVYKNMNSDTICYKPLDCKKE